MKATKDLVTKTHDSLIYLIRGQKVMLDEDLARIYRVETKVLNQAVKRNLARFPDEFMFQLSQKEFNDLRAQIASLNSGSNLKSHSVTSKQIENKDVINLKSQFVTSSWGGRRKPPLVFTEHGAVMLASVLNSPQAVHASIQVVKAFVRLRELLLANKDLAKKLGELEKKYDKQFFVVFDAIRKLMTPPGKPLPERNRVGYRRKDEK